MAKDIDLIVKSKVREAVSGLNVSGDVAQALNRRVMQLLQDASDRAKANGRRTLQARDI